MTKLFILFVFCVSTFAIGKSPLETFDLPLGEREAVVSYCQPTGNSVWITLRNGTKINRSLYESEEAGLREEDIPPYDIIARRLPYSDDLRSKKARIFLGLLADATEAKDACDKVAVLYVAKFIAHYWPGTKASVEDLNLGKLARELLERSQVPLIRNARIEARKMLSNQQTQANE